MSLCRAANWKRAKPVAAAIRREGKHATAIACHIGKRADCEALVTQTRAKYGQIDVLVCNAAINPYFGPMTGLSDEAFTKVMETNVRSNLWLANLVKPEMAERRDGAIIIVSSIGGLKGTDVLGIYRFRKRPICNWRVIWRSSGGRTTFG